MIVSKPAIVFHASQIFFNFIAMACFASVASFQARWRVGPSGLSGFAIFVSVTGMFLSAFMVLVPVIYEKYDKFVRLARALKEVRVGFILTGTGNIFSLLIAFVTTISAWTQPGCKNPDNDPHADLGDDFKRGLDGWCITKKAGAIFFWLAFAACCTAMFPAIPPSPTPPTASELGHDNDGDDEESEYHIPPCPDWAIPWFRRRHLEHRQLTFRGRKPMDVYGAFSDPAPSGFAASSQANSSPYSSGPPVLPEPDVGPRVSRTMQYADPYAAIRANIGSNPPAATPPSYESYQGYR
ncbi:hypothetical protein ONZ45_g14272 [Pleurotus djamor]|nr:hypothetical protein ONZ45_g14272 [Pleurotus djamor]